MIPTGQHGGRIAGVLTLVAVCVPPGAAGQARPDFTGEWTATAGPPTRGGGGSGSLGSGWGSEFLVVQAQDRLTIERAFFTRGDIQPPLRFHYALDGSESRNSIMMGRGIQTQVSSASWTGDTLIIVTVHAVPDDGDGPLESTVTRRLWLQPAALPAWPPALVVETVRNGVLDGPPSTTRTVYARR